MEVDRITPQELKKLQDKGEEVTIVDVRAGEMYATVHPAGALSAPKETIASACGGWSSDGCYVLY